jgi:DNA-binding NarL/FixJ family response regulator
MKIIIVEDNHLLRKIIRDRLRDHFPAGDILAFENGEQAFLKTGNAPVHIAVLDIHLPGMSGLQLTRALRKKCPDALIVIYTNYDTDEYRDFAIQSGADCFLSKEKNPPEDIVRKIEKRFSSG